MTTNTSKPHSTFDEIAEPEEKQVESHIAPHLAAMGQLAAGIAHEINTPAQYVSDNIYFLQDAFDGFLKVMAQYQELYRAAKSGSVDPQTIENVASTLEDEDIDYLLEQVPEAIQQSLEGMTRITQIVEAMRDFSHPGLMEKKVVDINKAIRNTVMVTRNMWKYACDLETELDETLPGVACQPGEINQVLLNLISNATDAVKSALESTPGEEKGKIRISTRRVDTWVEIQISDTGTGIPESIQNKIFNPFYTTKPVGKGTGQGLAIAASVIAHHGGTLTFETIPGSGTTFHIRLPLGKTDAK
jgi:signal transduction histidine kinase